MLKNVIDHNLNHTIKLPEFMNIEKFVFQGLQKYRDSFRAIQHVPHNILELYVHAY